MARSKSAMVRSSERSSRTWARTSSVRSFNNSLGGRRGIPQPLQQLLGTASPAVGVATAEHLTRASPRRAAVAGVGYVLQEGQGDLEVEAGEDRGCSGPVRPSRALT
jgi:hypothetical protein